MALAAVAVGFVAPARADDAPPDGPPVEVHAFISEGVLKSSDNNFLTDSARGSLEYFEAGLNVSKQLSDRLRAGIQLYAHDLGTTGNYEPKVDWAYLDYHWRDWLGIRAGHIKVPFGLYNDVADVDAARPTALLPQSVYPEINRNYLLAQSGFELYGYHRFGDAGALDYRAYGGMISIDLPDQAPGPYFVTSLTIPYVAGARLFYETPLEGLRAGLSVEHLRLEEAANVLVDPVTMMPSTIKLVAPTTLAAASLEYAHDDLLFAAEYALWTNTIASDNQGVVPTQGRAVEHRAYALAAYRVIPQLQLATYYALFYGTKDRDASAGHQHDFDLTLRYDLTPNWIVKLEGHVMRGTGELDPVLNPGPLADRWLLFVGKTTVYF